MFVNPAWPIKVKQQDAAVPDATFMASVAVWKEKGSDVNVASHLLVAVPDGAVDAAVVISNDSDLRWPIQEARPRVPIGLVNPSGGFTAGSLSGDPAVGAGLHWWRTLKARDFTSHQLADPIGRYHRPTGW